MRKILSIMAAIVLLASCAGKKAVTETTTKSVNTTNSSATSGKLSGNADAASIDFLHRVTANKLTATNVVASADFRLVAGSKNIGCDGKLSMRRGEIIRLQLLLPIIRTEIARIDFTPDYVLLVDRYHKEYIKASYKEVSFLADNGLSFYSLQALFWNQLFLPGTKDIADSQLGQFVCQVAEPSATVPVTHQNGNIAYAWTIDKATALPKVADITYKSAQHGNSSLRWTYDNYASVGGKPLALSQQFAVNAVINGKSQTAQLTVKMSSPKTSADWDTATQLSSKYKKIEAKDILGKLLSIQ